MSEHIKNFRAAMQMQWIFQMCLRGYKEILLEEFKKYTMF